MLELLANKLGDIYVGLLTGFATGIPCMFGGLLIDRWLKGRSSGEAVQNGPIAPTQGLTVTQAVKVSVNMSTGTAGGDPTPFIVAAVACVGYLFLREEILTAATFLTFGLFGVWAGVLLSALYRGDLRGTSWLLYLVGMLAIPVLVVTVVVAAKTPTVAPAYFEQWQQYAQTYGIMGMVNAKVWGFWDVLCFGLHVIGVAAMLWVVWDALLSMGFYASLSASTTNGQPGWWMRRTARYGRKPLGTFVWLVVWLALAYTLVDGVAFVFLIRKLPVLAQELMNYILYGARGALR